MSKIGRTNSTPSVRIIPSPYFGHKVVINVVAETGSSIAF